MESEVPVKQRRNLPKRAAFTLLAVLTALAGIGVHFSPLYAQETAPAVPAIAQHPDSTSDEPDRSNPDALDAGRAASVSNESNGLVALTVSLGAMSVIGLASGLWFRVTTSPPRRDLE